MNCLKRLGVAFKDSLVPAKLAPLEDNKNVRRVVKWPSLLLICLKLSLRDYIRWFTVRHISNSLFETEGPIQLRSYKCSR